MESRRLYIFVEGDDDEEFFKRIIQPKLEKKNAQIVVQIVKYAQ